MQTKKQIYDNFCNTEQLISNYFHTKTFSQTKKFSTQSNLKNKNFFSAFFLRILSLLRGHSVTFVVWKKNHKNLINSGRLKIRTVIIIYERGISYN